MATPNDGVLHVNMRQWEETETQTEGQIHAKRQPEKRADVGEAGSRVSVVLP